MYSVLSILAIIVKNYESTGLENIVVWLTMPHTHPLETLLVLPIPTILCKRYFDILNF